MSLRVSNLVLGVACVCFAASIAYCAPTIGNREVLLSGSLTSTSSNSAELVYQISDSLNTEDSQLSDLGAQLLKPPAAVADSLGVAGSQPKLLPAVPAAVFMGMCGFLCVSLVKDRRFWMAGLAAMFWVGQTGLTNLPRLAQRLAHSTKMCPSEEFAYKSLLDNFSRLRSELEGTEYIGLLHHLGGIPANKFCHTSNQLSCSPAFGSLQQPSKQISAAKHMLLAALFERQRRFNVLFKCLDSNAGRHISFSPAFIFSSLSRGPPQSSSMSFHTVGV